MKIAKPLLLIFPLFALSACDSWNKLVNGKEDSSNPASAPAPAPAPNPNPNPQQGVQRFDVYNDSLFDDGTPTKDPQSQLWGSLPGFIANQHATGQTNSASEGVQFFRVHSDGDVVNQFMHITYDRNLVERTVDISSRTALAFSVRFHRRVLLPGDEVFIFVEDGNGTVSEVALQSAAGIVAGSLLDVWQYVRIPTSSFAGINWSRIRRGFGVRIGTKVSTDADDDPTIYNHLSFDFDDIRYE